MRLKIERMTYGADAIAHTEEGKTVFVSGAVAGDVVEAELVSDGKSFSRAKVTEVIEASPDRVAPAWPFASILGCTPWAAMAYPAQLTAKRTNVVDALTRVGHLADAEDLVTPCDAPGKPWGYRNKAELAFMREGRKATLGMYAQDGTTVVRVEEFPLLDLPKKGRDAKLIKNVSGALSYLAGSHELEIERVGIRRSSRTGDLEVAIWTPTGAFPRAQARRVLDAVHASSIVRVMTKGPAKARKVAGVERLTGAGSWSEKIAGGTMRLSAPSFFQVNTAGAERLVELVLEALEPREEDVAMDLYSGAGTFTLPLARRCDFVDAVESYGPAVRDLRRNLEEARLDNVDAVGGDAGREFPDDEADIIVVDPPRAGLAEDVVRQLSEQPARTIAYVSCDPATLARDLARFREIGAFDPVSVTPVDLFPQTFHVETVTKLQRR
ncbi:23S rRNA (uracil(1939)-C(5))-methyltransferase RlmD [uncultured Parolsenella sp.]|uniref:23S rRNA (uracil(1939)-C(5))-methyltransferase RlmD n=1 Tax=uncultured Parolsenella sp. TaxID=2083008 RepID=UPI0025FB1B4E|nr:23S rRNA (uracil(1939)-C(5))-methyltransferase RlmD [uncultured Parolsenella sp.]